MNKLPSNISNSQGRPPIVQIHGFTFTGKERDEETEYGYFGARYMDHELLTGWLSVDPMADKYPSLSPYAYCAWSPVKLVDPDGEEVYILLYTKGNRTGDGMFKAAALTRKRDIERSKSFNPNKDIVVMQAVEDLSSIEGMVDGIQKQYGEKYGKTKEFDLWSHGGLDGPVGSKTTSNNQLDNGTGCTQMALNGWGAIVFNWSANASANFYGCRTGEYSDGKCFAKSISGLNNFIDVNVSGLSDRGFPSYSPTSYQKHSDNYFPKPSSGNTIYFSPTYLVSSNWLARRMGLMYPQNTYQNGVKR